MLDALRGLTSFVEPAVVHLRRQRWSYIFGAFIWALVWYAMMNLLTYYQLDVSLFPFDVMPLIAGVPIILVGWRAVAIGDKLELAIRDFDDGAAFVFPAGKAGTFRAFLADFRNSIKWWSRAISATIVIISLVGVILLTSLQGSDLVHRLLGFLLLLGVPLIALPIGTLLGQLMGFGQFTRIMGRHGIKLAGVSTPQARNALRVLESVRIFAVIAPLIMCYWFAGWWIVWQLGYALEYEGLWRPQFLVLWFVSIALYIFVGVLPARSFRKRVDELSGGAEGRAAREEQLRLARSDLDHWRLPSSEKSRHQRQRIAELQRFIANLEEQRIESWLLDTRLLIALLAVNLVILLVPYALALFAAPLNPAFQGQKA